MIVWILLDITLFDGEDGPGHHLDGVFSTPQAAISLLRTKILGETFAPTVWTHAMDTEILAEDIPADREDVYYGETTDPDDPERVLWAALHGVDLDKRIDRPF